MFKNKSNAAFNTDLFSAEKIDGMHETMERLYLAAKELAETEGQTAVANLLNASPQKVNNWEARGMSKEGMLIAEERIGVSAHWLRTGVGSMRGARGLLMYATGSGKTSSALLAMEPSAPQLQDLSEHPDLQEVPRVKFKLSAGVSGYAIEPENGNGKPVFFRQDWFETNGFRPELLFSVRVSGASMEPALWDGDLVVINTADTSPHDGDAFAMNYEGELVIKRLRRDAGEWWATSDNADQRRFAPKRCTEDVKIIGRVVYKQSERI
jgi:phage repressor protein C with HTH and peptisase S24 domain